MKNVWKGLVIGSFAGAAVGVLLDVFERLGRDTQRAAEHAKERAPELAEQVKEKGAELAEQAKEKGAELADQVKEKAPEVVESARESVASAADRVGR